MTALGKYLVVANFVVSVMIAGWCAQFYFNAIDWSDRQPGGADGVAAGQQFGRSARVKELQAASWPAEIAWREARFMVRDRELNRAGDRGLYQTELAFVYANPDAKVPLHEFVLDANGQPVLVADPTNKAHFLLTPRAMNDRFGQPLHSLVYYADVYRGNLAALKTENDKLVGLSKEDADLTVDLTGGAKANGMVVEKALRKRIEDERLKGQAALAEYEVVKPLLIKTVGDSEFLLARRKQLEKRLKELQETKGPPPQ